MDDISLLEEGVSENPGEVIRILVLADAVEEAGWHESAAMLRQGMGFCAGGFGGGGFGSGDGDGSDGDGDAGGGGDGDGDGGFGSSIILSRGFSVRNGLYIICSPGGYYPYVRIAWCQRVDVWIEMTNCRVIRNFGTNAELIQIATDGPLDSTRLLKMAKTTEGCSVGMVSRRIECDPKAWEEHCPKPKNWME